jgi:hypothetical protein
LPVEIDSVSPKINMGYTLRGCPNKCSFCIVWIKEPILKRERNILEIWDGNSKLVVLLDNNALADLEWFIYNCELAIEHKITLDWNQGLDHRKLTPEIVDLIKRTSHKELRFAFDNPKSVNTVENAICILKSRGINRSLWYVLVNYNTTFEEDLFRVNFLRERGQLAYIQRYRSHTTNRKHIALAQWVNQHHIFQSMTWQEFLNHEHSIKRGYGKLFAEVK